MKTYKAWFEGGIILACMDCIKKYDLRIVKDTISGAKQMPERGKEIINEFILIEGYHRVIKKARERRGLSQEELAKLVGEKTSTIKRIEAGKLTPTDRLVKDLERVLKIKLREENT